VANWLDVAVIEFHKIRLELERQQNGNNREWTPMNANSKSNQTPRSIRVHSRSFTVRKPSWTPAEIKIVKESRK
jgi:hypothetical protein